MKIYLFFACVFFSFEAIFASSFDYSIQFGEKTTRYFIKSSESRVIIKTVTQSGDRIIKLSDDNRNFLFEQVKDLAKFKSNEMSLCRNGVMKIEYKLDKKVGFKVGCINSLNPTAVKMTTLANLLSHL